MELYHHIFEIKEYINKYLNKYINPTKPCLALREILLFGKTKSAITIKWRK